MTPIQTLIQQHGGQVKLAAKIGKTQAQVSRWKRLGAVVDESTGVVYCPTVTIKLENQQ